MAIHEGVAITVVPCAVSFTRECVDGLGVGGVLPDVVPVELAEEVAAVPLGLVLRVLQHRRRHHGHRGGRSDICT